uniref:ATP synthase F0 subunit 8 n=1 Tax=Mytilisepta virgata TaxID=2547956 RepID=A0A516EZK7_MYTVI|nr:ATP synthase F0 subunit 8 [Mytilisepta virgata]
MVLFGCYSSGYILLWIGFIFVSLELCVWWLYSGKLKFKDFMW